MGLLDRLGGGVSDPGNSAAAPVRNAPERPGSPAESADAGTGSVLHDRRVPVAPVDHAVMAGAEPGGAVEGRPARKRFERRGSDRPPQGEWERLKEMVREQMRIDVAPILSGLSPSEVEVETRKCMNAVMDREGVRFTPIQRRAFIRQMMSEMLGLGPLDGLLADPTVTEIMCNRFSEIWVERDGLIQMTEEMFSSDEQYRSIIQRIVSSTGRRIDEGSPMVDARLQDGSRVNVILPPLALDGPALTIRKFSDEALTVQELLERGVYTEQFAVFMQAAVHARLNILVSGGTGSGKTTTLNVLSSFIPRNDRIITIEDSAELQLQQPHVVRLEARPPNTEGAGLVSIRDLVRNALRMRPNRLILGEIRGAEAIDLLQAVNTGHGGSMSTLHANSTRDAIKRMETMVLMSGFEMPLAAIREQIASAVQLLVHVERLPSGHRIVQAVSEVQGLDGDTILVQDVMTHGGGPFGAIEPVGLRPRVADRIEAAGIELPPDMFRRAGGGSLGRLS